MEAKDLVLLLMIPLLAISLIGYTDKSPVIIGAVTTEQEQSIIFGTYSINPSFKAKIDYNLNEYKTIQETFNGIIEECKDAQDMQCLRKKAIELNWNCEEKESTAILHDFVDKFNECLNLDENGVVCKFSFDDRNIQNSIFNIRLTSENEKLKAELMEGANILEKSYIDQEDVVYTGYSNKDSEG